MADLGRRVGQWFARDRTRPAGTGQAPPAPAPTRPGVVEIIRGGEPLWGTPANAAHWDDLADANLRFVVDALRAGGVEPFLLDAPRSGRRQVVILDTQRGAAREALVAAKESDAVYLSEPSTGRKRPTPEPLGDSGFEGSRWLIHRLFTTPQGQPLAAEDAACEVQLWTESTADTPPLGNHELFEVGSLLAPGFTNRWTHVLPPEERHFVQVQVAERTLPAPPGLQGRHIFDPAMPIDVVYTWVDGGDPEWQRRKAAALGTLESDSHRLSGNPSRFESHDELRYSLRSLAFYADWVNHIWVVTDGQVPSWLTLDHPRLTVVDHRSIFRDPSVLPVFNSHAIESQLHHIDGLSEHYLYLNDDVFFTAPATPDQYVLANGITQFHPSSLTIGLGSARAGDTPVAAAAKQNRTLVREVGGVEISHRMQHVAHPLRRSVMAEVEERFPREFATTASARLRSPSDLSVVPLAHYYGFLTGQAVPGRIRARYADIANPDAPGKLRSLLELRNFDQLCLNDTASEALDVDARRRLVGDFLASYFPYASPWERSS